MSFLPQGYERPQAPSNYMRFQKGMNRFRILSPAVIGYEYWNKDNKPVRSELKWDYVPDDIKTEGGVPTPIKHFWAFIVWNYQEKMIQILQITQATIQDGIKLGVDLREGNAMNNDIGVERIGDGFDTEYKVQFADPSPIAPEIEAAFKAKPINLHALFDGSDPFQTDSPTERGVNKELAGQNPATGQDNFGTSADIDVSDIPFWCNAKTI